MSEAEHDDGGPAEPLLEPAAKKRRSNAGAQHPAAVREAVWTGWQRAMAQHPELADNQVKSLHSKEAIPLLKVIGAGQFLNPKNMLAQCRDWIGRKLKDPDCDLTKSRAGAGGATEKHKYPPVTFSIKKRIVKRIQMKRWRSCNKTLGWINDWLKKHDREDEQIQSAKTISNVCTSLEIIWTKGSMRPRQAGQHEVDGPPRVRYAKMMKQWSLSRQKRVAFSDEKIFALSETNKGGYWPDLNLMDEFIWGIMVSHMKFCDATSKEGLKRELKRVWKLITPEVCERCVRHYFQEGGTLDSCIAAEGKRFSRGVLQG